MSLGIGQGRFSHWPRTLARLAKTGSVQNARQSLGAKYGDPVSMISNYCFFTEANKKNVSREGFSI